MPAPDNASAPGATGPGALRRRTCRADAGRDGLLRELGHRGQRGGAPAPCHRPPLRPGAHTALQLPRAVVRDDVGHRQPLVVGLEPEPAARELRAQRRPLPEPVGVARRRCARRGVRSGPARGRRDDAVGRRRVHDRRARPGRRRLRGPAGRLLRRDARRAGHDDPGARCGAPRARPREARGRPRRRGRAAREHAAHLPAALDLRPGRAARPRRARPRARPRGASRDRRLRAGRLEPRAAPPAPGGRADDRPGRPISGRSGARRPPGAPRAARTPRGARPRARRGAPEGS